MSRTQRVFMPCVVVTWALAAAFAGVPGTGVQQPKSVLDAEDANELRLNTLQPPDRVLDAVGVRPGMTVAEIGAGRGRYAVQLAVRVGPRGKVYAEDIDQSALEYLDARCRRWNLANVVSVLGEPNDPRLPAASLDLIFIISSFHHFEDPVALLGTARRALRPGGRLAIVEWAPRQGTEYLTPGQMTARMKQAGYVLEKVDTVILPNGLYIYLFRRGE